MVVESVFEDLQLKKELFNQMGEILKQRCVPNDQMLLCSNTMNLSLAEFSRGLKKHELHGRFPHEEQQMVFRAIHADATEMMFFSQIVVVEDLIAWLEQRDPRYAYVPADYVEPPELQTVTAEAPRIDADTISRVRKPLGEGSFGTVVSATTWKPSQSSLLVTPAL